MKILLLLWREAGDGLNFSANNRMRAVKSVISVVASNWFWKNSPGRLRGSP